MPVKFFGQFLVEKNIVTIEDLLKAVDFQDLSNLKLGEMAVAAGYITQADCDKAHNAQMSRDMKLGGLLVEMGFMTDNQLNEVITRHKNNHLYIGEALVRTGALTSEQLQQHLSDFNADQARYLSEGIDLPDGISNKAVWEMTADMTCKMITRMLNLQYRLGKSSLETAINTNFMMAALDITGDVEARYLISVSEGLQKTIAKAILLEDTVDDEPYEILEDTVKEFVNVICGNIAAKASQMGIILNIQPPFATRPPAAGLPVPSGRKALTFPIYICDGEKMELILLIKI